VAVARAIGRKAALEMLLTGRYVPAHEAKGLGLINRVVPLEELETETEALASKIAEASRFVLSIGKSGFYAQVDQPDNDAMDFAKQTMTMNLVAEDAQEGIQAFIEKREPTWKNK
jgi:enoyl-CoA hydratase/carnithine racemase